MTGQRYSPEELTQRLTQLIRYEMQSVPTASIGRLKTLDRDTRRAEVETVPDGGSETNVPVASTFANDGVGDLRPIDPEHSEDPVYGIVLYTHHPMDEQLSSHGSTFDGEREQEEENAVFLPAQIWFDDDDVPDHDGTERRIDHPTNGHLEIDERLVELVDQLDAGLVVESSPEPDLPDGPKDFDAEIHDPVEEWGREWVKENLWPDNTAWPIDEDAEDDSVATRLRHPDGTGVTVVDRGVAVEGNRRVTAGRFTDGERQPLAGEYQHFHTIQHDDGTTSLAGPQLSFREFIAWMTAESRQEQLRNAEQYAEERQYARLYLEWLEEELGREIDPTDPEDWPDPEPMPAVEEHREWFDPVIPTPTTVSTQPATAATAAPAPLVVAQNLADTAVISGATTATAQTPAPSVSAIKRWHATVGPATPTATSQAPTPTVSGEIIQPRTWVDTFEYSDTAQHYSSQLESNPASFQTTTAWGDESNQCLQAATYDGSTSRMRSFDPNSAWYDSSDHDPLNYYPKPGDTIHVPFRVSVTNDGSYNGSGQQPRFGFGVNGISYDIWVQISMGLIDAPVQLHDRYASSQIDSGNATASTTIDAGDILEWVIDWGSDYYITVDLYNRTKGEHLVQLAGQGSAPDGHGIMFRDENAVSTPARFDAVWVE